MFSKSRVDRFLEPGKPPSQKTIKRPDARKASARTKRAQTAGDLVKQPKSDAPKKSDAVVKASAYDNPGTDILEIKKPAFDRGSASSASTRSRFTKAPQEKKSKSAIGLAHSGNPLEKSKIPKVDVANKNELVNQIPANNLVHNPAPSVVSNLRREINEISAKGNILTVGAKLLNDIKLDFTEFQEGYENQVLKIPQKWIETATSVFKARNDLFNRINKADDEALNQIFEKETLKLKDGMEEAKKETTDNTNKLLTDLRKLFVNREHMKQELKVIMDSSGMTSLMSDEIKELSRKLKEYGESLEKERIRYSEIVQQKAQSEASHKHKIEELKALVSTQEEKIADLATQVRMMKQKDIHSSKSGTIQFKEMKNLRQKAEMLKFLENRIAELTNEHSNERKGMEKKLGELERELAEKTVALERERAEAEKVKSCLDEAEDNMEKVRGERKLLTELVDKTKIFLQPPLYTPSKREEELCAELEATRVIAKGYEQQLERIKDNKTQLMKKFEQLAEDQTAQQSERLAAEIVRKDDIIKTLKRRLAESQKKCEEHSAKYKDFENRIKDIKEKYPKGKADQGTMSTQIADLKLQVINLQQHVNELTNHNDHLESSLVQRCLELEQRDQLLKHQCNLLNVKDNLITLLKKKEENYDYDPYKICENEARWKKGAEKIHKTLETEAPTLDELNKILHDKQFEISKLNEQLQLMETQNDKAQHERIRMESTISELQKQLYKKK